MKLLRIFFALFLLILGGSTYSYIHKRKNFSFLIAEDKFNSIGRVTGQQIHRIQIFYISDSNLEKLQYYLHKPLSEIDQIITDIRIDLILNNKRNIPLIFFNK